jgi:hypothetical protein
MNLRRLLYHHRSELDQLDDFLPSVPLLQNLTHLGIFCTNTDFTYSIQHEKKAWFDEWFYGDECDDLAFFCI